MTITTTTINGRIWYESPSGWVVYTRDSIHMRSQSLAMHEVKGLIKGDCSWDELIQTFRDMKNTITAKGIKWTIDISIYPDYIEVCRRGKMLPSIWVLKSKK